MPSRMSAGQPDRINFTNSLLDGERTETKSIVLDQIGFRSRKDGSSKFVNPAQEPLGLSGVSHLWLL